MKWIFYILRRKVNRVRISNNWKIQFEWNSGHFTLNNTRFGWKQHITRFSLNTLYLTENEYIDCNVWNGYDKYHSYCWNCWMKLQKKISWKLTKIRLYSCVVCPSRWHPLDRVVFPLIWYIIDFIDCIGFNRNCSHKQLAKNYSWNLLLP